MKFVAETKIRFFKTKRMHKANIVNGLTSNDIEETDEFWSRAQYAYRKKAEELAEEGKLDWSDVERFKWQWQWANQVEEDGVSAFGLERGGLFHGFITLVPGKSKVIGQRRKKLLCINTMMAAPFNRQSDLATIGLDPQYQRVGTALLDFAKEQSVNLGFNGVLGTEPIQHSPEFYEKCGMQLYERSDGISTRYWAQYDPP